MDKKKEVFTRVFKEPFIYRFYDSDSRNLVFALRIWEDKRTMDKVVKEYWDKVGEGLTFEEFLDEKGIVYEDIRIEGEFEI